MLSTDLIQALKRKGVDGDKARVEQAIQNAGYEGKFDDERWILKEAIRLSKPYGLTMTPREMLEYLRSDENEEA
jgi:hypothetical protein